MPRSQTRAEPERRCIVSGESRAPDALIRFVVGPDDTIVPDVDGRLPGRGIWLSADRGSIDAACKRKLFARAARKGVSVSETLADDTERLLLERCLDRLGLARRAGEAVAGFEKVADWIRARSGKAGGGLLIEAADGAPDGRGKLARLAERVGGIDLIDCFTSSELARALGLERAVHVAVSPGGNARQLRADAARLAGVRANAAAAADKQCLQPGA